MINICKPYVKEPVWNIAGLFCHDEDYLRLFNFLKNNNISNPIKYVYGSFLSKFEGGRTSQSFVTIEEAQDLIYQYNDLNISCRLILSNHLIQKKDLEQDKHFNNLLSFLSTNNDKLNLKNGVTVTLDPIAEYIQQNYSNLEVVCSVIKPAIEVGWGLETVDYYNNLLSKYDFVVVNSGKVKDINFIQKLQYKEKIEVIINSRCELNCPYSKQHYDITAKNVILNDNASLNLLQIAEQDIWKKCHAHRSKTGILNGSNFSEEEINILLNMNITHFKMEGREWPIHVLMRDFGDYIFNNYQINRIYRKMGLLY